MSDAQRRPLLEAAAISKRFGSIRALDDVSLKVGAGEVHGLIGANGAGKSTLIGILSGAVKPDAGALRVADKEVPLGSVSAARAAGLTVVHQELMLFPDRTVEENVFASVLPSGAFRWTDRERSSRQGRSDAAPPGRRDRSEGARRKPSACAAGSWSRSPARSAQAAGFLCSTSPPRRCRSRKREVYSTRSGRLSRRMRPSSLCLTAWTRSSRSPMR